MSLTAAAVTAAAAAGITPAMVASAVASSASGAIKPALLYAPSKMERDYKKRTMGEAARLAGARSREPWLRVLDRCSQQWRRRMRSYNAVVTFRRGRVVSSSRLRGSLRRIPSPVEARWRPLSGMSGSKNSEGSRRY